VKHVRRQGLAVIWAVVFWGAGIAAFGLVDQLWLALAFLAFAGAADVVSAVFRSTILQLSVPDALRGRLSGIHILVVTGGPRLGDLEAGLVAAAFSPTVSVVSGGLLCIVGAALVAVRVPSSAGTARVTRPDYAPRMAERVRDVELRVLEGPNLYFPRPAIKLTLAAPGWLALPEERFERLALRVGVPGRPGRPGSEQRRRAVARLASHETRRLAEASRVRLAVRARPGSEPDRIVVAFPWRHRGAAEGLAREVATLLGALLDARRSPSRLVAEATERLELVEPGEEPTVPDPAIPSSRSPGRTGRRPPCACSRISSGARAGAWRTPPPTACTATTASSSRRATTRGSAAPPGHSRRNPTSPS